MNVYDVVTTRILERIIDAKNNGKKLHWVKPWTGGPTLPMRYGTGKAYQGINLLLLEPGNEYITFHAIQEMNESRDEDNKLYIKKNSHTSPVVFYNKKAVKDENGEPVLDEFGNPAEKWYAKYYRVFNREDIKNLPSHYPAEKIKHSTSEAMKLLDKYIADYIKATGIELELVEDGTNCFFDADANRIRMPMKEGFKSAYAYYSSALHEIIHSTAIKMNRNIRNNFGSSNYSREELIAQIGSQMLLNQFRIVCDDNEEENDIAYIDGWLSHLKEHSKELAIAASHAEKAAMFFVEKAEAVMRKNEKKIA